MNIRYRNIKTNSNGVIVSGSASLVKNTYQSNSQGNRNANHSKQTVVERLGKVVWIDKADKKHAIFDSPSRGLVSYYLSTDVFIPVEPNDERLRGTQYQAKAERIHTSFGNTYLFFSEIGKTPLMKVLRSAFSDQVLYQKVLAHLAHDCLKNRSAIKCGEFLSDNWLSYILTEIPTSVLDCDSSYFMSLSDDNVKTSFFRALVEEMIDTVPEFGRACYVDSTPLPGEAHNNPFNALCSHGTDGAVIQARMVLILDIKTNIPIWFEIIPSNVLDKCTILSIRDDVKTTLGIEIDIFDLDAGYARKELFELFNRNNNIIHGEDGKEYDHAVLCRMPGILGYPRDELYVQCKPYFYDGDYSFDYEHHTFFGERVEIDLFGYPEYAFVFIDKTQAESLLRKWRKEHLEEWESLSKSAKDWYQVKDGFFVLVGNKDQTPKEALVEYRGRTRIEVFFRDGKAYLGILPLAKWNRYTVKGKIFHDIMETIFYREYRKRVSKTGLSMSSLIVSLDSWECFKLDDTILELKTPRTQVRELLEKLGYSAPGHISLSDLRKEVLEGIPMDREPVTTRSKRTVRKPVGPISPEEKRDAREQEHKAKVFDEAKKRLEKLEEKADSNLKKATEKAEAKKDKVVKAAMQTMERKLEVAKKESTKAKIKAAFEQAVKEAEEAYNQAIEEAKATSDKAKTEAKAAFIQATTESNESE